MSTAPAPSPVVALDVFGCPLDGVSLVEASAGTGKTWNLCGLYLRLLLERGLDVSQVLVVTFTNAATAELRDRIRQRLVETQAYLADGRSTGADPFVPRLAEALRSRGLAGDVLLKRLAAALAGFDDAAILTIHGFCQRAAADHAFAAQLPLETEVLRDAAELVHAVAADFWRRRVAADDVPAALSAWMIACGDSPHAFAGLLRRHLSKPLSTVRWPAALDARPAIGTAGLEPGFHAARACWLADREAIVAAVEAALAAGALNKGSYGKGKVARAAAEWEALFADGRPLALVAADAETLGLFGADRLAARTNKGRPTPAHAFFDLARALLDAYATLSDGLKLARLALIREFVETGPERLREETGRRRQITYDGMLVNLHRRLHDADGGAVLEATLRERYPAALIDEFQDTDPIQYGIFGRIHGRGGASLFLIGDPKQAIYGFRGADLHTYLAARADAGAHYTLEHNQRSSAAMLDALNALFGANRELFMLPGLAYRPVSFGDRPRPAFVDGGDAGPALALWMLPGTIDDGPPLGLDAARRRAAEATADEIARLLGDARAGTVRIGDAPLTAGGIAVLVRAHREGRLVRRALARRGVLAVEHSREDVFRSVQAEELARVLAAVLEPARPAVVRAALATSAMGRTAVEIARLEDDERAYVAQVDALAELRRTWLARGVGTMLRRWMRDERVARRLLALDEGERALTDLLHLVEALHEAEGEHPSPDALLRWLHARRTDEAADDARLLRLESDEHLVQIVTVHAAKGLEYPVVFCPFLWTGLNGASSQDDCAAYHDADGRALLDYRRGLDPGFDADAVKAAQRDDAAGELLRLIYVALTRAVHRLVLVAGCWTSHRSTDASSRSLLNWIAAGEGTPPRAWLDGRRDLRALRSGWSAVVAAAAARATARAAAGAPDAGAVARPPIAMTTIPDGPRRSVSPPLDAAAVATALSPPARLPAAWRIGSYSGLVHGATGEGAGEDHDVRAVDATAAVVAATAATLADDDPVHLVGGREVGTVIHGVLERIDFTDPSGWDAAVEDALPALPPPRGEARRPADTVALRRARLLAMLRNTTSTPLDLGTPSPLRLDALPRGRRLVEMEFHLPAAGVSGGALDALMRRHGYACPRLDVATLDGYLKGFVDLVFEHDGRYFVLDWKSNRLGTALADYGTAAIEAEMDRQGYHLQYLLYLAALHRWLGTRVPGYDPGRHLGGAVYLFVRAVRPGADGAGVFVHRPRVETIEALSALLGETEALDA